MGPSLVDNNQGDRSFLTTGIWNKLQGKDFLFKKIKKVRWRLSNDGAILAIFTRLWNNYRNFDFYEQTKLWTLGFYLSCLKIIWNFTTFCLSWWCYWPAGGLLCTMNLTSVRSRKVLNIMALLLTDTWGFSSGKISHGRCYSDCVRLAPRIFNRPSNGIKKTR